MIMHPINRNSIAFVLFLASIANLTFVSLHLLQSSKASNEAVYTYRGHDYPETLPMDPGSALLTVEESTHYPLLGNDSDAIWFSLTSAGYGYTRLGPEDRIFIVTMFHELHCMRVLNIALVDGVSVEHVHHCLNYLRQLTLCSADLTLEPGDFAARDFESDRTGATHTCRDWSAIYDDMQVNMDRWMDPSHA